MFFKVEINKGKYYSKTELNGYNLYNMPIEFLVDKHFNWYATS